MNTYHKIQTVWLRDPDTKFKTLLEGEWSLPEFEYLANNQWFCTEKVDGTNIRVMPHATGVVYKGKTDAANIPSFLLDSLKEMFDHKLEEMAEVFANRTDACLYGEGYGNKIQGVGKNYIANNTSFVLFDVKVGDYWLKRADVEDVAKTLGVPVVPIITIMTLPEAIRFVRRGFTSWWGDFEAEGLVCTPTTPLFDRHNNRIITKIKTRDFARE